MRKLILEEWMSLDGYVADKAGGLEFFTHLTPEQNTYSDSDQLKFLRNIDTILLGRKTYELFVDFWPEAASEQEAIADRLNEIPKLVVSGTIKKAPWGKWPEAGIIGSDATGAVRKLKGMPGAGIVLWGSVSLAQALMKEKLIDEIHIQLCPVVLGGGRPLFGQGMEYADLELTELRKYDTGTVFLNYRPK